MTILGVIHYLWPLNFILAAFNILPAFPLDGGRVLRAALWKWRGNIHWATRIASRIGSMFGFILIFIGIYFVIRGPFITGIWWILIGFFLHNASQMSYRRLLMARALQGEPVRRFMQEEVITVEPTVTVKSLVEDFIYRYHYKMFPVVRDGILIGCITTREVKEIPREQWDRQLIGEALQPCSKENTISVNEDATKALAVMHQSGNSRLMVTDDGRLVGIIALKDLLQFLSLKMELEPEALDL